MSTTVFTYFDPNSGATGWTAPVEGSAGQIKVRPSMRGRNYVTGSDLGASSVVVNMIGASCPCSVWVKPASGNAMLVEYSVEDNATVNPAQVAWLPWPNGAVTTTTMAILDSPVTALRFSRTVGISSSNAYGVVI
jgi:hypothetical protein